MHQLRKKNQLKRSDNLLKLDPFFWDNLLRVGGRLCNALIGFKEIEKEMHPFIFP